MRLLGRMESLAVIRFVLDSYMHNSGFCKHSLAAQIDVHAVASGFNSVLQCLCGLSGSPVRGVSIWLAGMGLCDFCSSAGVMCCLVLSDPFGIAGFAY